MQLKYRLSEAVLLALTFYIVEIRPYDIKIGVILPSSSTYPFSLSRVRYGIEIARERVENGSMNVLRGHRLNITYGDSQCSDIDGPLYAIDMYYKKVAHVFIGPACDYVVAPVARFSPRWNIPVITGAALVRAFSDKKSYALLTRMLGSYSKLAEFVKLIFERFDWVVTTLVYSDAERSKGNEGRTACHFVMEAIYQELKPRYVEENPLKDIWYKSFDTSQPGTYNLSAILRDASLRSRNGCHGFFNGYFDFYNLQNMQKVL